MPSKSILLPVLLYALLFVTPAAPCTVISGVYYYDAEITICSPVELSCSLAQKVEIGTFLDATFDAIVAEGAFVGPPMQLEGSVCPVPVPYEAKCCSWNNKYCGSDAWCNAETSNCEGGCGGSYINPLETTQCLALWTSCTIGGTECCGNAECFLHEDGWLGCERIGSGLVPGVKEPGCCSRDNTTCPTWSDTWCSFRAANCKLCLGTFLRTTAAPTRTPTKTPTKSPTTPTIPTRSPTKTPTRTPTKTPTRLPVCKARYAGCAYNSECCSGNCWYASIYNSWKECLNYRRADRSLEELGGEVELKAVDSEYMSEAEFIARSQHDHVESFENTEISLLQDDHSRRDATVYKQVSFTVSGLCKLCPPDNGDRKLMVSSEQRKLFTPAPVTPFTAIENILKVSMDSYLTDALNTRFSTDPNSCLFGTTISITVQFAQIATPNATAQVC